MTFNADGSTKPIPPKVRELIANADRTLAFLALTVAARGWSAGAIDSYMHMFCVLPRLLSFFTFSQHMHVISLSMCETLRGGGNSM